ncbi:unnamed protein product [Scytosiphon promiscuus]
MVPPMDRGNVGLHRVAQEGSCLLESRCVVDSRPHRPTGGHTCITETDARPSMDDAQPVQNKADDRRCPRSPLFFTHKTSANASVHVSGVVKVAHVIHGNTSMRMYTMVLSRMLGNDDVFFLRHASAGASCL